MQSQDQRENDRRSIKLKLGTPVHCKIQDQQRLIQTILIEGSGYEKQQSSLLYAFLALTVRKTQLLSIILTDYPTNRNILVSKIMHSV